MLKILKSFLVIAVVGAIATSATGAYFSDSETSTGNTFSAGSLDLNVDGGNTNVVKFNVTNMRPGNQPTAQYTLANVGTINGYLDLANITVTDLENGITEPESSAGDITDPQGELSSVLGLTVYWDNDGDGYYSVGDVKIYDSMANGIASSYDTNKLVTAGSNVKMMVVVNWWNTPNDNLAQTDSMQLDFTFNLSQNM
ncbi:MAG: Camelysin metallo-endopeptidase [bacterium ADurb.Bin212]|jgi:predicted ribosomally synthesized peptide with SipW-like signal peptide|nr:MAG: Camelysin metallo-endopeptidase [bacterium ADurb.Bin212]